MFCILTLYNTFVFWFVCAIACFLFLFLDVRFVIALSVDSLSLAATDNDGNYILLLRKSVAS